MHPEKMKRIQIPCDQNQLPVCIESEMQIMNASHDISTIVQCSCIEDLQRKCKACK